MTSPSANPASPTQPVLPANLVPPSLAHLHEAPGLAGTLGRVVERCLRARARFPHTLLTGPRDSGKRSIAHMIAAEMAVPIVTVELQAVTNSAELHSVCREASAGSIVLVSGLDDASGVAVRDIARAARRIRLASAPVQPPFPFGDPALSKPERPMRPYADFTIIATARGPLELGEGYLGWVEQRFFLKRTAASEAARLARLFARAGLSIDVAGCRTVASYAIANGVSTLSVASAVADWMLAERVRAVSWQTLEPLLGDLLGYQVDPAIAANAKNLRAARPSEDSCLTEAATDAASTRPGT